MLGYNTSNANKIKKNKLVQYTFRFNTKWGSTVP